MSSGTRLISVVLLSLLTFTTDSFATHPLITDDTGTEGQGHVLVELNNEYEIDGADLFQPILNVGVIDTIDITASTTLENFKSASDPMCELKWRFIDRDHYSFALKPTVTIPIQDKTNANLFLIATQQISLITFHENIGYGRFKNLVVTVAAELNVINWFQPVIDIGSEDLTDRDYFVLGGMFFWPSERIMLDIGVKYNRSGTTSILTGLAVGF